MEIPIGNEHGVEEGVFLGKFEMDPELGMQKEFWSGIGEWDPYW